MPRTCQPVKSHGGRLSNMQKCEALLQSRENPRRDFFARTCQSITSHGGRLSACRSATRFCNPRKIHGWIFRGVTYAGLEGPPQAVAARQWRRKPAPWKARGAKACPVELAKEQNGRAGKGFVQKIRKITNPSFDSPPWFDKLTNHGSTALTNHGSTGSPTTIFYLQLP